MKYLLTISFLFLLCYNVIEAQQTPTYADSPAPEHVLIVYNNQSDTSGYIKDYYQTARGIPAGNVVGLSTLVDTAYYNGERVILAQDKEIIRRDAPCSGDNNNQVCEDNYAWQYFEDNIAAPIRNHLNTQIDPITGKYLYQQIRYIVLCKGIPIKIQSGHSQTYNAHQILVNVSVCGLLSVLNTNGNQNPNPVTLYKGNRILNPYDTVDPKLEMTHRFLPNYYSQDGNIKLSYLVSILDGIDYEEVESLIYRSVNADTSGEGLWILDGHENGYSTHNFDIYYASQTLKDLGFSNTLDLSDIHIFNSTIPVMGYTSQGGHAGLSPTYFQTSLNFEYLNGAVCNTYESYNCYSMNPIYRRDGHGLISEFIKRRNDNQAGSAAVGHCWEPYSNGIIENRYFFPTYALGYNIIDAIYMGMYYLAWQNVVICDPLTRIYPAYKFIVLGSDSTINTTSFFGKICVPDNYSLIFDNSHFTLPKNSVLEIKGNLSLPSSFTLTLSGLSRTTIPVLSLPGNDKLYIEKGAILAVDSLLETEGGGGSIIISDNAEVITKEIILGVHDTLIVEGNASLTINNLITLLSR